MMTCSDLGQQSGLGSAGGCRCQPGSSALRGGLALVGEMQQHGCASLITQWPSLGLSIPASRRLPRAAFRQAPSRITCQVLACDMFIDASMANVSARTNDE